MNANTNMHDQVTILIPHYQTLDLIRLCLRSIRKHTQPGCRVLVLDNGSQDESIKYLKSLSWIELVETGVSNHIWNAHFESLNRNIDAIQTPYFLIMHSDTFVHSDLWLTFLLREIGKGYEAVGPRHQRIPVRSFHWLFASLFRDRRVRYCSRNVPILRSSCALYRTDLFRSLKCKFICEDEADITFAANEELVRNGHRIYGIPASRMSRHIFHASAMTVIKNTDAHDDSGTGRTKLEGLNYVSPKTRRKSCTAFERFLNLPSTQSIIADDSLDH